MQADRRERKFVSLMVAFNGFCPVLIGGSETFLPTGLLHKVL
jgi:hypothetical protein